MGASKATAPIVIVADDYDDIRRSLRLLLEAEGFEVHEARDGREAVATFTRLLSEGVHVDAAILDHMMPHLKGDVAAVMMREHAEKAGIAPPRILPLTGSKDGDLVARWQAAGVHQMFIKPGFEELLNCIKGRPLVAARR
jgi:CheY-like chemotaxis protein